MKCSCALFSNHHVALDDVGQLAEHMKRMNNSPILRVRKPLLQMTNASVHVDGAITSDKQSGPIVLKLHRTGRSLAGTAGKRNLRDALAHGVVERPNAEVRHGHRRRPDSLWFAAAKRSAGWTLPRPPGSTFS